LIDPYVFQYLFEAAGPVGPDGVPKESSMTQAKTTLKRLREEEREARKNLIIDAAIALFAQRPYNQVGMRDIAAEAGLSAASIYRYFADRDDLFIEAFIRESSGIEAFFNQADGEGRIRGIEDAALRFVEFLFDHDAFFQMMTYFMVEGGIRSQSLDRFNQFERKLLDHIDELFRKTGVGENVRLLSHAFFASLNGLLITFRNYPGRSPEEVRRHLDRLAVLVARVYQKGATA
jgi:AcrR family transcriptional regulator